MEPSEGCDISSGRRVEKRNRCLLLNIVPARHDDGDDDDCDCDGDSDGDDDDDNTDDDDTDDDADDGDDDYFTCAFSDQSYLARCTCCQIWEKKQRLVEVGSRKILMKI